MPRVQFLSKGLLPLFGLLALVLLPLAVVACGAEEPTRRPTRERRDPPVATEQATDQTDSKDEDRPRSAGLLGGAGGVSPEGSVDTDREALVALYEATDGDNWFNNENWLTGAPLGEWYGITTDRDGRVWEIQLDSNGLDGEIPAEIGVLDSLVDLNLDINVLRGPIPPELGDLVNLEKMNLVGNGLIGDLPRELARLSNLRDLVLPGNNLSGSIPSWLTELTDLQILYLTYNDFSGEIPRELGEMGSLVRLELGHNNLTGQIPAELGLLEDLVHLGLENNRLSGDIPDELEDLHSLLLLGVAGNPQLGGCVPGYLALQLDSSSDLGDVPVCGGLALGGPAATIAIAPTAARPAPVATLEPMRVPTSTPWPTPTWAPTNTPRPTSTPAPILAPVTRPQTLEEYARQNAGGPGAIYVGDLNTLVGRAPSRDLGDDNSYVPLDALQRHSWIFESDYYRSLLDKANLTDPTQLTSSGQRSVGRIDIGYACIHHTMLPCQLLSNYFAPNVQERTNGQVTFQIVSLWELGVSGAQIFDVLSDGTLDGATLYGGYVIGESPAFEINHLYGAASSAEESYLLAQGVTEDLDRIAAAESGGVIFGHVWYAGHDQFLFCKDAIESASDFQGKRTRSHSAAFSDWINGLGGNAQLFAFAEVYTALERGSFDCAVTGADAGFGQRWYEVSSYMNGPLYNTEILTNVINGDVWDAIPADLQQIILEEGAKLELEALRLAPAQTAFGLRQNIDAGMVHVQFSPELQRLSRNAAIQSVIPDWVGRVGDPNDPIITDTFNNKVGPIVGMRINSDGTVTDLR